MRIPAGHPVLAKIATAIMVGLGIFFLVMLYQLLFGQRP
jgi:hypothetical protein